MGCDVCIKKRKGLLGPPTTTEEEDFFELAGLTATATPLRDARLFV